MIQLTNKQLSDSTQKHLSKIQQGIDSETDFVLQAEKAQKNWKGKESAKAGKEAFEEIKKLLKEMSVSTEVCNYCEQNEGADIEHIAPKSFFPNQAFIWENYLLACKNCNSGYKLDKCSVLDSSGLRHETERGTEPLYSTHCFINPRKENPNDFFILNSQTFKYFLKPKLTPSEQEKAKSTLEILKLNERDTLIQARENASIYFYERLERLTRILSAKNLKELKNILTPYDDKVLKNGLSISEIKEELTLSFKKNIQTHQHPSVWYAIKLVDSKMNEKWKALFDQVPEALNW